jgi:microcystin-dependent protein
MSEPYVGEVRAMPFGFAPTGWAPCQGQLLSPEGNAALYQLLGTTYGGDGKSTFALPTLAPVKADRGTLQYCIAIQGVYPPRP